MHKMRLVTAAAVIATLSTGVLTSAATNKPAPKKVVKAAPAAADFDQAAAMKKFKAAPDSAVVATVNGQAITKGELMSKLWDWMAPSTLNELVNQKMVAQGAKKAGVTLTPTELNKKLDEVKGQIPGSWKEMLRRQNYTEDYFVNSIKTRTLAEMSVQKSIKATDAEYAQFVKASHILVKFPQGETDKAKAEQEALDKAKKIYDEIKGGKDFAAAAKEYSDDTFNKDKGGDLGWFKRGSMVPEFEAKAFSMKAGEISEPTKTVFGYHIIKLEKLGKDASPAEKADLGNKMKAEMMPQKLGEWFNNLKNGAKITNSINPPLPPMTMPTAGMPSGHPTVTPAKAAPRPAPKPAN